MSNQTEHISNTRPQKVEPDLHTVIYQNVSKARKLSIDVLGSNASIGHALAIANQDNSLLIGIHDGTPASVQEAFAVAIRCLAEDHRVIVIRRNYDKQSKIPEGMALYGTGGIYDHGLDRYQPTRDDFIEDLHDDGTPFTPCGLAWRHHGSRTLANLGCPKEILRTVYAEIMNGIIRDIDHESARETPFGIWTVAKAVAQIDHKDNCFDDSVAAFTRMAMVAKQILLGIMTESILRTTAEEVSVDKADMDFIWHNAFKDEDELNGNMLVQRPKLEWNQYGYRFLEKKGITLQFAANAFEGFKAEIIPTLMGEASENYGMTVFRLAQIFGLRYADELYEIIRVLLDGFAEHERRLQAR